MEPAKWLELGICLGSVGLGLTALYLYARFFPIEEKIPPEYFFKVREPKVRLKREIEAKLKKIRKEAEVEL